LQLQKNPDKTKSKDSKGSGSKLHFDLER